MRLLSAVYPRVRALRDVTVEMLAEHEATLPPVVARRCRFIVEEDDRVLALGRALTTGDKPALGRLCAESYAGARDLYEIGAPTMETMMAAMLASPGAVGARQAGAGFGGCMVALVEDSQVDAFAEGVKTRYAASAGIDPHVYPVRPSAGAGPIEL